MCLMASMRTYFWKHHVCAFLWRNSALMLDIVLLGTSASHPPSWDYSWNAALFGKLHWAFFYTIKTARLKLCFVSYLSFLEHSRLRCMLFQSM